MDLNCVDWKTGKLKWSEKDFGKAAVTLADGHLWITTKKGDLLLVRANPMKYEEVARAPGLSRGGLSHVADDLRQAAVSAIRRISTAWISMGNERSRNLPLAA